MRAEQALPAAGQDGERHDRPRGWASWCDPGASARRRDLRFLGRGCGDGRASPEHGAPDLAFDIVGKFSGACFGKIDPVARTQASGLPFEVWSLHGEVSVLFDEAVPYVDK